jgi:hypothetical protein
MDERERRLVKNETHFRDLNERVEAIALAQGVDDHVYEFLCECSNRDCTLRMRLTLAEYEQARRDPDVFVVGHGHELPEIETVVVRREAYALVRKLGEAGAVAKQRDPRR